MLELSHSFRQNDSETSRLSPCFGAFEKIADQQKRVRVEVDTEKLEYEYA